MSVEFLGDWRRTHYSSVVTPDLDGVEVTVFGWIQDIRDHGNIIFLTLSDKEGLIQITGTRRNTPPEVMEKMKSLSRQSAIGVKGVVSARVEAPRGVEVIPREIKVLGLASHPLPLDPTGRVHAEIDVRLDARILDLRRPEPRAIFKVRHKVVSAIREYLDEQGFIEVHTPKIIATAAEGGAALFPVDYFNSRAYLAQSPELYKEELITVFEKVYEIGTYFRAEESHTRRHLNEFISVDVEEAFVDYGDVMKLQEDLLAYVLRKLSDECMDQLNILKVNLPKIVLPLKRYKYSEIVDQLNKNGYRLEWGEDLSTSAYRVLGKIHRNEFYFIIDWPTETRPFYVKPKGDSSQTCEAFDLMYEWLEITSGGSRVDRKEQMVERLRKQGLDPANFEFHLKTYDYGMPPHAGWGLGLDRLLMALLRIGNIREVVLFPRDRFRLTP
ncbi:aspartate--tRNA(Asn) ligase [Candidatus Bathyarchaeota archaeon]|nr:aspartate--tRNA(Asn) ligase [Candidatus Bathyarchaeota archaeon]MBS7629576.1 aspartate--tRNA(Asn) ligase [Candidatus Bathyarchaeota archaeon]